MDQSIQDALRKLPLPVTVVSVGRGGVENALTVSWVAPVSFDPPMLMISVNALHHSREYLESTRSFVVNVLSSAQRNLAGHFAKVSLVGEDKLEKVATREAESGAAIIEEAVAWFDCEVKEIHDAGDHRLCIGQIIGAGTHGDEQPLTTMDGIHYLKHRG